MTFSLPRALLLLAPLVLAGCSDSSNPSGSATPEPTPVTYDSLANPPLLPFPNAVYRGENGRIALPLPGSVSADDLGNAVVAVNSLDGFSTTAPLSAELGSAIDPGSLVGGDNVRVFEIEVDVNLLPAAITRELVAGEEYDAVISAVQDSRLLIKPSKVLSSDSHYLVGVGDTLMASDGILFGPSADYRSLREGDVGQGGGIVDRAYLSALVQAQERLLSDAGMDNPILSFSFQTQSNSALLAELEPTLAASDIVLERPTMNIGGEMLPLTTEPLGPLSAIFGLTPTGQADIYTGTMDVPYYMNVPASATDDNVYDSFIRNAAGLPIIALEEGLQSQPVTIPVIMAIPNGSRDPSLVKPAAGWPVAMYMHGIFYNRFNVLLIADALAAQGVAMVAIDHPMHGILPDNRNFAQIALEPFLAVGVDFYDEEHERHFNLDLDGDGLIDFSSANFSSPRNLLTSRDNLRQSVSDLVVLTRSLPGVTLPDADGLAFDPENIHVVSQSLGSFATAMLAGINSDTRAYSLATPGAGGAKSSEGSPSNGADYVAQLAELGFIQGTQDYEDYLTLLTTVEGSADSVNYVTGVSRQHPVHLIEVVGNGTPESPPDQTVPNVVDNTGGYMGLVAETAPLAGTEALISTMALEPVFDVAVNPDGLRVAARFTKGDHTSLVNPTELIAPFASPDVTQEMHRQVASFIASGGTQLNVENASILEMNFMPAR